MHPLAKTSILAAAFAPISGVASESIQSNNPSSSFATITAELMETVAKRPDLATLGLIGAVTLAGLALLRRGASRSTL